ncbi:MAG: transporter substrate-binding domain-containing protein [Desulfobulbaceae bacterium]|nr:transporter substrate-binding domain-containing protein [Desulfobulbaceae bacterium]
MNKLSILSLVMAVTALVSVYIFRAPQTQDLGKQESVYEHVMRTGVIRCGYIVYPPNTIKDPNSGALSGISNDIMARIAKDLSLSLEWKEETSPATMVEGLRTGRFDMLCTNVWASASRGKVAQFSSPLYFTAINAYVRKDDLRFSSENDGFDKPDVTIATIDGGIAAAIAKEDYPQARLYSLPELTDFSHLLLAVKDKKADVTFSETAQASLFEKQNPMSLRNPMPEKPARLFANSFMIKLDDYAFANMLNNAIATLQNNGFIDSVLSKYSSSGDYRRVARGYQ